MSDLITLERALLQLPNAPTSANTLIADCISACSDVINTYCFRNFAQATYDEIHSVTGPTTSIWVNNPPIIDVVGVRNSELPALYVQCADPLTQTQLATVDVTSTAVVVKKIFNNVVVTNATFDFVTYPTFTELAAGINALGNNWSAVLPQQFAKWATSDLTTNQSGRSARNISLPLTVFWYGLVGFKVNKVTGEIILPYPYPGYQNYRITYVGGFATVPDAIQQACAELVQLTYLTLFANPLMQSETIDRYSYTKAVSQQTFGQLSETSRRALNFYRVPRFTIEGVPAQQ